MYNAKTHISSSATVKILFMDSTSSNRTNTHRKKIYTTTAANNNNNQLKPHKTFFGLHYKCVWVAFDATGTSFYSCLDLLLYGISGRWPTPKNDGTKEEKRKRENTNNVDQWRHTTTIFLQFLARTTNNKQSVCIASLSVWLGRCLKANYVTMLVALNFYGAAANVVHGHGRRHGA